MDEVSIKTKQNPGISQDKLQDVISKGIYETNGIYNQKKSKIINCMFSGGVGALIADSFIHSLDTVKTRQQGFPHVFKYKKLVLTFKTIFKEEGFFRGLYSGYTPVILGSFPSSAAFFFGYEYVKRKMIDDFEISESISYCTAGIFGDILSSIFYVPSEVLKTRLQLQGRYGNPYSKGCEYNYKNFFNALSTIIKTEGFKTLFYGYKETLMRDVPYSALQFLFYEKLRQSIFTLNHVNDDSILVELFIGFVAGGCAGGLTTPLDVIKTRIQTTVKTKAINDTKSNHFHKKNNSLKILNNYSLSKSFNLIYHNEGFLGLFSGFRARFVWTGIQSSIMFFLYQSFLKKSEELSFKLF